MMWIRTVFNKRVSNANVLLSRRMSRPHRPRKRRLHFEPLEERTVLSVSGVAAPAAGWVPIPDQVLVAVRSDAPTRELGDYLDTIDWPTAIGPVAEENVEVVYTIPWAGGSTLTVLQVHLKSEMDAYDAAAELEEMPRAVFAEPNVRGVRP